MSESTNGEVVVKKFTKKRKEIPLLIEEEDGTEKNYILRELGGTDRDWYIDYMNGRFKGTGPDGRPTGMTTFKGIQSALLSRSLFDDTGKLVPIKEIEAFPGTMQTDMYFEALKLSALDKEAEERAKKALEASA